MYRNPRKLNFYIGLYPVFKKETTFCSISLLIYESNCFTAARTDLDIHHIWIPYGSYIKYGSIFLLRKRDLQIIFVKKACVVWIYLESGRGVQMCPCPGTLMINVQKIICLVKNIGKSWSEKKCVKCLEELLIMFLVQKKSPTCPGRQKRYISLWNMCLTFQMREFVVQILEPATLYGVSK